MARLSHEQLDVAKCGVAIDQINALEHDAPIFALAAQVMGGLEGRQPDLTWMTWSSLDSYATSAFSIRDLTTVARSCSRL
jgi:hypothetical protein